MRCIRSLMINKIDFNYIWSGVKLNRLHTHTYCIDRMWFNSPHCETHSSIAFTKLVFYSTVIASMKSKIFFFWVLGCFSSILSFAAFVNIVHDTRMIVRSYRQWECASKVWKISLITLSLNKNHCRKKILQKQCYQLPIVGKHKNIYH